jgi:colanic acid biosynthesis glycosyl transferase WcaI
MAHIVILNQFFWPDGAPTADYAADLASHLSECGHEVSVICGKASYGEPSIKPPPQARVFRLPIPFSKTTGGRLLFSCGFLFLSALKLLQIPRPDCVVTLTTPPLLSLVGLWAQLIRRCRHVIWEMDAYPELAIQLGAIRANSVFAGILTWAASQTRSFADQVMVLGPCMADRYRANGLRDEQIAVIENWPSGADIQRRPLPSSPTLRLLYSGNLGRAHDWNTLRDAVRALASTTSLSLRLSVPDRDMERVKAVFGSDRLVTIDALCPREELPEALAECHIGVVTQSPETLGCLVPSKFYNLFGTGRPVLFIGPESATPARKIRAAKCGWVVANHDVEGLRDLLLRLSRDRREVERCAENIPEPQTSLAWQQASLEAIESILAGRRSTTVGRSASPAMEAR